MAGAKCPDASRLAFPWSWVRAGARRLLCSSRLRGARGGKKPPSPCPLCQELGCLQQLTSLHLRCKWAPGGSLGALSSLARLRSLRAWSYRGGISAAALTPLSELTHLSLSPLPGPEELQLHAAHFAGCTALRQLSLSNLELRLSAEEAEAALLQLESFHWSWEPGAPPPAAAPATFWRALPRLPRLAQVRA